jgi:hypothetical protein
MKKFLFLILLCAAFVTAKADVCTTTFTGSVSEDGSGTPGAPFVIALAPAGPLNSMTITAGSAGGNCNNWYNYNVTVDGTGGGTTTGVCDFTTITIPNDATTLSIAMVDCCGDGISDGTTISLDITYDYVGASCPNLCGAGTTEILTDNFSAGGQLTWTMAIVTGVGNWQIGDGGASTGVANLEGDNLYFDDDALGSANVNETATATSPAADLTCYTNANLSFDYYYNDINTLDFFAVDVWDGAAWVNILNQTTDQLFWTNFSLDVSAYINSAFQVRFTYDDGNAWSWYAAVDNFALCATSTPPANDECAAATPLTVGTGSCTTPTNGNNAGATDSGITLNCGSYSGGDVWYAVTVPPGCDNLVIETSDDGTGGIDTQIGVFDACGGTLIDCDDDGAGFPFSQVVIPAGTVTSGTTLYVSVSEYLNNDCGTFNICAYTQAPAAPANDECAAATPLTVGTGSCTTPTNGTNAGATDSGITLSCGAYFGGDVWYAVTVPSGCDDLVIETSDDGTGGIDTQIGVFDACGGTLIDCDDDGAGFPFSQVIIPAGTVTAGTTLYVSVSEFANNECGTFNICAYTQTHVCPVIDFAPDVTSVCSGGNVTFTAGALCTLVAPDQVADLYVYIDPMTGQPGTAPAPLNIAPGTQTSQMASLHPDWINLFFDGDCATPLVGNLINTQCAPTQASLAIVTYDYSRDSDCDGDFSEYDGCALQMFSVTIYPDINNFTVTTTPGGCGTAATATLELISDGTDCATQTGTIPTTPPCGQTSSEPLNYNFVINSGQSCSTTFAGTVAAVCVNLGQAPGTPCNDGNNATTNDVIQADGCTCAGTTINATVSADNTDPCFCVTTPVLDGSNNVVTVGVLGDEMTITTTPATTGLTWNVTAGANTTITSGPTATDNGDGTYTVNIEYNDTGAGWAVTATEAGGNFPTQNATGGTTCTYTVGTFPNPASPAACAGVTISGATPAGGTYSPASIPAPAPGSPAQVVALTYTYDAHPAVGANPACPLTLNATISIPACPAAPGCNADNGTPSFNP